MSSDFLKNVQREIRNLRTEHGDRMSFDDAWDLAEAIDDLIKERIRQFADGVMDDGKDAARIMDTTPPSGG